MLKGRLSLIIVLFFLLFSYSAQVFDTLYITRKVDTIAFMPVHLCVFSDSAGFKRQNDNFWIDEAETWNITIVNLDSVAHDFTIDGVVTSGNEVQPSDTITLNLNFPSEGSYAYYSSKDYGIHLGASGLIQVGYNGEKHYYWNMFDQDTLLSQEIGQTLVYNLPVNYRPQVFLINNLNHPVTLTDPDQYVQETVGDSIVITIFNSGKMNHTIHFHGYHVEIVEARESTHMIGWSKDTFPVVLNELMTIRLIPDQEGIYPVHDHNLTTLTTGAYPGGMLIRLNILP